MNEQSIDSNLLDIEKLDRWLVGERLKPAGELKIEQLTAGRSNEMFVLEFDNADGNSVQWVLRRPSGVAWEKAEKVLRREFTLLNALSPLDVATPKTIVQCEDKSVIGAVFYLMEKVEGFIPAMGGFPDAFKATTELQRQCGLAGIEAIAAIHRVDWRAAGLADYGKPEGFHERQVGRWTAQYESYGGRELPGLARIGEWLQNNLPVQWAPTIMHGDYHALNILMAPELPPRISAIVDWETSTIGDPFLDVVGFLDIWYDANSDIESPDYDAMVAHYLSLVDFAPENFTYYRLLFYFRQSVLLEGIYQRSLQDDTREDRVEMAEHVDRLIQRAEALL